MGLFSGPFWNLLALSHSMFFSSLIVRKLKPRGGGGSDGFGKGTRTSEAWSYASISRRSSAYSHRNRYSGKFEYTFVLGIES